jgi:hypothetical protein
MVDLAKRAKKHVKEIRVRAYRDDDHLAPNLEQIGMRYALLLAEQFDYRLCSCDYFLLMRSAPDPEEFKLIGMMPVVSTVMFRVDVRFDMEKLASDYYTYTVNLIARVLKEIACTEGADPEPIDLARNIMLTDRDDVLIPWKSRLTKTTKYLIEPSIKMKGMGSYSALLFVRLTELATGKCATRLVLQAPLFEVRDLARKFSIKNRQLVLGHKQGHISEMYRRRGFIVPVTVPLAEFDWKDP